MSVVTIDGSVRIGRAGQRLGIGALVRDMRHNHPQMSNAEIARRFGLDRQYVHVLIGPGPLPSLKMCRGCGKPLKTDLSTLSQRRGMCRACRRIKNTLEAPPPPIRLVCSVCGALFTRTNSIYRHNNQKRGTRTHQCSTACNLQRFTAGRRNGTVGRGRGAYQIEREG